MLANWILETTATTGTGTITLGGAYDASYVSMNAHPDVYDGQPVEYIIKDGNNREEGIGTFTASGTTLSRDTIIATLVSGVYDNTAPTAISLSGSAVVALAPSAGNILSGVGNPYIAAGTTFNVADNIGSYEASATTIATANRLVLNSGYLATRQKFSYLVFNVGTADAACTHLRFIIYAPRPDGDPGKVLYDSGNIYTNAAATGLKEIAITTPFFLPPGKYYMGGVSDSTTLAIHGPSANTYQRFNLQGVTTGVNHRHYDATVTGVTGAPTDNPTVSRQYLMRAYGLGWRP